ncbi:hypothetical protein IBTHAUMO2_590043 [Nitrosopumilaceae archaeon]|nr:hypothetical protein IBTHAUMO2_590043 [Nitrosopumilaceae archaeon]
MDVIMHASAVRQFKAYHGMATSVCICTNYFREIIHANLTRCFFYRIQYGRICNDFVRLGVFEKKAAVFVQILNYALYLVVIHRGAR